MRVASHEVVSELLVVGSDLRAHAVDNGPSFMLGV